MQGVEGAELVAFGDSGAGGGGSCAPPPAAAATGGSRGSLDTSDASVISCFVSSDIFFLYAIKQEDTYDEDKELGEEGTRSMKGWTD